jgi:putative redox protein
MDTIALFHTGQGFQFDIKNEVGYAYKSGLEYGVRPMQSILAALASCSAIDIVTILEKKRIQFTDLSIVVQGEREQHAAPSLWKTIHAEIKMRTAAADEDIEKVIALSIDKYCSVAETLRRAGATINWKFTKIN